MLTTNGDAREGLDEGDEKTSREDRGSEATAMELTLLEKVKRWFAEGFLRGAEDRLLRADPSGILTELHFLLAQTVRYLRFPLDAAFAILDAEVGLDDEEKLVEKPFCILGLGYHRVAGDSKVIIDIQSSVRFRPETLLIPSAIANDFVVVDLKVGKNSQFTKYAVTNLPIPATFFCTGNRMPNLDVCEKGQFVTVVVRNVTCSVKTFTGSVSGPPVEE